MLIFKWSFYNRLLGYIIILGYFVVGIYAYNLFGEKVFGIFSSNDSTIFIIISIDLFLRIMAL